MRIQRDAFETMVRGTIRTVIASLPADLRERAREVVFEITDRPTPEQVDREGFDDLLGLYEGISLIDRHIDYPPVGADRIYIFRIPLMEMCRDMRELRKEVRITVIHELGHYFGFDEGQLEELGLL